MKHQTYPDLVAMCTLQSLMEELNRIVQAELDIPILLSYDTAFSLGDIYVSPLLFCYVLFAVVPTNFLLHERKFEHAYESFMAFIKKVSISKLNSIKLPIPFVTDDEQGL